MTDSRGPRLAVKRRDGHLKGGRNLGGGFRGDLRDASLESVYLQVRPAKSFGEVLAAQPLELADFADPSGDQRGGLRGHVTDISESDSLRNALSGTGSQARDSVRDVPPSSSDLGYDECEQWMRVLGYEVDGKPDWKRLLREADVGTGKDVLKKRWLDGEAPRDRAKVRAKLLEADARRRERTVIGRRLVALEEWERIGEALAIDPAIIEGEIARLRDIANKARATAEAERVAHAARADLNDALSEPLRSITPGPKTPRK